MGGDEAELIAAWQLGDRRAGDVLVRRHLDALRRFLRRNGGPIEDLVQETLLQCQRKIGSFRGEARFQTFLLAVASNVRRKHARSAGRALILDETAAKDIAGEFLDLDARLDGERILAALDDGLALLPDQARRVIHLQYWDELTSGQIASLLVVPAGSVRRWQTLARRKLARSMRVEKQNRFNRCSRSDVRQSPRFFCEHSADSGD
jgi:RNA polymerase sigma-70 factor (ECF subfamily)